MGYAEKNLAEGETILYRARYHWVFYSFTIIVLVLAAGVGVFALRTRNVPEGGQMGALLGWFALAFVVIGLVAFLGLRVRASMDEFVLTNRRVIRRVGLFARQIQNVPLEKIQDITIEQGIFARMLGYGTVIVETASENGMLIFPKIASPDSFRARIWRQTPPAGQTPPEVPATPAPQPPQTSLEELESLKQRGLLSEEEYAAKRQEILSHL